MSCRDRLRQSCRRASRKLSRRMSSETLYGCRENRSFGLLMKRGEKCDRDRRLLAGSQESEGIFFVQPNKQDKPNKRIRLAGHAGSRSEVFITSRLSLISPFTLTCGLFQLRQFHIHHSSFPIPLHLSVSNSELRTQNFFARPPSPLTRA